MKSMHFLEWCRSAAPGSSTTYHEGYLPNDRIRNPDVVQVAGIALILADAGVLDLVQTRDGEFNYTYRAIKRRVEHGNKGALTLLSSLWRAYDA